MDLFEMLTRSTRRHQAIIAEFERTNRSLGKIADKLKSIHDRQLSIDDVLQAEEEQRKLAAKLSEMLITANQIQTIYNDLLRRSSNNHDR